MRNGPCAHACVHICMRICMRNGPCGHAYVHIRMRICMRNGPFAHAYVHICMPRGCLRAHIRAHMHAHTARGPQILAFPMEIPHLIHWPTDSLPCASPYSGPPWVQFLPLLAPLKCGGHFVRIICFSGGCSAVFNTFLRCSFPPQIAKKKITKAAPNICSS